MLKHLLLSLLLLTYVLSDDEVINDDDPDDHVVTDEEVADDQPPPQRVPESIPGGETISYKQPALSEEEQKSHHFPDRYRCDACQIVVHNLGTDFKKAESKLPKKNKKKTLGDIAVIEIVDDICTKDKFEGYSIQEFDGKVVVKGPAFPDRSGPGMSMGGGLWPVRYVNYCGGIFEEFDEDEVYKLYRSGDLFSELCVKKHCKGVFTSTPEAIDIRPDGFKSKDEL